MTRPGDALDRAPVEAAHDALGVQWVDWDGVRAPGRYGPVAEEHALLVEGRALVDRSAADAVEVTGEDRRRFLNGYLTCDVQGLATGRSVYGFLTNAQGRILADATVLCLPDRFLLELPASCSEVVTGHLSKYVIADRVEIRPARHGLLTLFGEAAERAAGAADLPASEPDEACVAVAVHRGLTVVADRRPVWGLPALTLWARPEEAEALWEQLLEAGRPGGLEPVGLEALEVHRVERGRPRFGPDFGPDNFPQETGLEDQAVSYSKGCYLGQEVVARIHYRGKVNRTLCGLLLDGPASPAAELLLDGRPVGRLGSVVTSVALGRAVALAILHRRGSEPGTRLEIDGGGEAEVVALPLV